MRCTVISLESALERRAHIQQEFKKHNINFEFFDALVPDQAAQFAASLDLDIDTSQLSRGELACFMSHVSLWKKIIDEDLPHLVIFEDDVYLGEDAQQLLSQADWLDPNWHIIKIEAFSKKVFLSSHSRPIIPNKRYIYQLKGENLGTAGYILSKKGAQAYLNYISSTTLLPLDELMFDKFINEKVMPVMQMVPALCVQEMILNKDNSQLLLPSALVAERQKRMRAKKKSGLAKLTREADRIAFQAKKALFAKELTFQ